MTKSRFSVKMMVTIGILTAMSYALAFLETPPILTDYLRLDASDVPAVMGAVMFGPAAGVFVELIKNFLCIFKNTTEDNSYYDPYDECHRYESNRTLTNKFKSNITAGSGN